VEGSLGAEGASDPGPEPPPALWASWVEVQQVRELLQEHCGVLLRRPDHVTGAHHTVLDQLLASPIGPALTVVRTFLPEWYALWRDENGAKHSLDEARQRYDAWRQDERYATVPALQRITNERFPTLSAFRRSPLFAATNNGAERGGRAFRHGQAPHMPCGGHMHQGAVRGCAHVWVHDGAAVQSKTVRAPAADRGAVASKSAQGGTIDLPVLQGFIDARPAALETRHLRQRHERPRAGVGRQGITQVEERAAGA